MELFKNVLEFSSLTNFNIFAMLRKFYILKRWVVQFASFLKGYSCTLCEPEIPVAMSSQWKRALTNSIPHQPAIYRKSCLIARAYWILWFCPLLAWQASQGFWGDIFKSQKYMYVREVLFQFKHESYHLTHLYLHDLNKWTPLPW